MLIKSSKSNRTRQIDQANRAVSTEGKQLQAQSQELQVDVQSGVSDIVRKHDQIFNQDGEPSDPTSEISDYLDSFAANAPKGPEYSPPVTANRYVMINGRLTLVKKGRGR